MIKINDIKDSPADLYDPKGNKIGTVETILQLDDVRIQIIKEEVEGYYFLWEGEKIVISKDGYINDWPDGFFDTSMRQLEQILTGKTK